MGALLNQERLVGVNAKLVAFVKALAAAAPFDIRVNSGVRSDAEQFKLWAQGRLVPGTIITYAKNASESAHGRGGAVDVAPSIGGRAPAGNHEAWAFIANFARDYGLTAGADWKEKFPPFGDLPHVEIVGWRKLPMPTLTTVTRGLMAAQLLATVGAGVAVYILYKQGKITLPKLPGLPRLPKLPRSASIKKLGRTLRRSAGLAGCDCRR